jgi:hypothetical protein
MPRVVRFLLPSHPHLRQSRGTGPYSFNIHIIDINNNPRSPLSNPQGPMLTRFSSYCTTYRMPSLPVASSAQNPPPVRPSLHLAKTRPIPSMRLVVDLGARGKYGRNRDGHPSVSASASRGDTACESYQPPCQCLYQPSRKQTQPCGGPAPSSSFYCPPTALHLTSALGPLRKTTLHPICVIGSIDSALLTTTTPCYLC